MMENKKQNPMRKIKIEKVILSVGGIGDGLEKGCLLLERITKGKSMKTKSNKKIPALNIRTGLEVGAIITIRKNPGEILKKMLEAEDNTLSKKQISKNNFSFGVKEYIEIPGMEYQRDIGMLGLDVTVVFTRTGKRTKLKKIKKGKIPQRQGISKKEIIKFMEDNFETKFE